MSLFMASTTEDLTPLGYSKSLGMEMNTFMCYIVSMFSYNLICIGIIWNFKFVDVYLLVLSLIG